MRGGNKQDVGTDWEATGEPEPGGRLNPSSWVVCKMKLALRALFRVQVGEVAVDLEPSVNRG